jgi:beta-N-acetylhexosaminidase
MTTDAAGSLILAALDGTSMTQKEAALFNRSGASGITLFRRNLSERFSDVKNLTASLQACRPAGASPLLVAIDQEGGRVARLGRPFPNLGPAFGLLDDHQSDDNGQSFLENYGFVVASVLSSLGINVNFAPVCDTITRKENTSIGDRAFSDDASTVALRAGAFLSGMSAAGVLGCLKHFPGQGDAQHDTHASATRIDLSIDDLEKREILPFADLVKRSPMVMMSHAVFSALDDRPASLSDIWMRSYLREKLGFTGVVVSDDMNMKAMPQDDQSWSEAIVEAVACGADLILVCEHLERSMLAIEALKAAMKSSKAIEKRVVEAAVRIQALRLAAG